MKLISNDLVKALIEYLMTRPYGEVANAVAELSRLQDAPEEKEENAKKN